MKYKAGEIVKGRINAIVEYGAFIVLEDDTVGLLHISEISDDYIKNVSDVYQVNDIIKVKIAQIKDGRLILSTKDFNKNKRRTKYRNYNRAKLSVFETNKGFKSLKEMLPHWIADYEKRVNDDFKK